MSAPTPSVAQQQPAPKERGRGVVKEVRSGDLIVVSEVDKAAGGPPPEREIALASIAAPKLGRRANDTTPATPDQPFAWDAREFLRKKVIGKRVEFQVEGKNPNSAREYATVFLTVAGNQENVNESVVAEGWATVNRPQNLKQGAQLRGELQRLVDLEDAAIGAQKGIHVRDEHLKQNAVRPELTFRPLDLFNQLKGKTLSAVVEQVRNGSTLRVTLVPSFHSLLVLLSGVQAPQFVRAEGRSSSSADLVPQPFAREAKFFIETHVLQRDIELTLDGVDKQGNFFGSVVYSGRDVGEELLKQGLASFVQWSSQAKGLDGANRLKAAEKIAKDKKLRLWTNFNEGAAASGSASAGLREIEGKVVDIANAGTVVVQIGEYPNATEHRIALSSIKAPRTGLPPGVDESSLTAEQLEELRVEQAYVPEAKEYLRKRIIGHRVLCKLDYARSQKGQPDRPFYSVYLNDQNIAVGLVERGHAKVAEHRPDDERSPEYDALLMAEAAARSKGKGWWGGKDKAPARHLNDLSLPPPEEGEKRAPGARPPPRTPQELQRVQGAIAANARKFLPLVQNKGPLPAVVDYVFSGSRFKVSVPKSNVTLLFSLAGIKIPRREEGPEAEAVSNAATAYTRDRLHLRDVEIEIENVDKGGNFTGVLSLARRNFAVTLLEQGLAAVNERVIDYISSPHIYKDAEDRAKAARINLWKNYDPEVEKRKREEEEAAREAARGDRSESVNSSGEYSEVVISDIVDASTLYIQLTDSVTDLEQLAQELQIDDSIPPHSSTVKKGDIVKAQFSEDGTWYRARILDVTPDNKYLVQYIDYGNTEFVTISSMRKLSGLQGQLAPQAHEAKLAYIRTPKLEDDLGQEALAYLRELVGGKRMMANIEYRYEGILYISLGDLDTNVHVSAALLRAGLALFDRRQVPRSKRADPSVLRLQQEESLAQTEKLGLWQYGASLLNDDEDENLIAESKRMNAPKRK